MTGSRLNCEQYQKFKHAQRRLFFSLWLIAALIVWLLVLKILGINPQRYDGFIFIYCYIVGLFVVIAMLRFRCPVCREVPRAEFFLFDKFGFEYSSGVAFFPKKCRSCGVLFECDEQCGQALLSGVKCKKAKEK